VVAKVEFHSGELFPRVGFIVTNLEAPSRAVVRFYNKRGTAEQWIKEGKQAVKMTRLSCHRFRSNQVRLALSLLAYKFGKPLAAADVAKANRELVADELAATAGEDRRSSGETCPLLLAAFGREPSNAPFVREHGAADCGSAGGKRVGDGPEVRIMETE
jgi:Transposase DDE domain group 1